jgi:hypothetical protein
MNKIKTIICLITFVFVSAAFTGQYEYIKVNAAGARQVFTYFPTPKLIVIGGPGSPIPPGYAPFGGLPPGFTEGSRAGSPTTSVRIYCVYRLTISPDGTVTKIRVLRHAEDTTANIGMLHALVLWKAKPSTMVRVVDVEINGFFLK